MANAPVLHWSVTSPSPTTEAGSRATWEAIRRGHKAQGYHDIAYNHGGGNDGATLTGRGWDRDSAANGVDRFGVNRNPGSRVFCWLGGPGDVPSAAAYRAMRAWADEARRRGYTAAVVDHKGLGVQTSCAGPDIPAWIAAGMPADGLEDDMPSTEEIVSALTESRGGLPSPLDAAFLRYHAGLVAPIKGFDGQTSTLLQWIGIANAIDNTKTTESIVAAVKAALAGVPGGASVDVDDLAVAVVRRLGEQLAAA